VEDYPEALLDDLPADYFRQESVEDRTPEEHGPQKWLILNDPAMAAAAPGVGVRQSRDIPFPDPGAGGDSQNTPPLLLSGTAGSGKTTISVYYLLRKGFRDKKRLFLTFSPFLRDFSERIYAGLATKPGLEETTRRVFACFASCCRKSWDPPDIRMPPKRRSVSANSSGCTQPRLHRKYDAELVWEEIRSIIKGAKPSIALDRLKKDAAGLCGRQRQPRDRGPNCGIPFEIQALDALGGVEEFLHRKNPGMRVEELARDLGQTGSACAPTKGRRSWRRSSGSARSARQPGSAAVDLRGICAPRPEARPHFHV